MASSVSSITSTNKAAIVYTATNSTGINPKYAPTVSRTLKISNGTGANQANRIYVVEGTIAASGTATIDVTSLTDIFGNAIALTRVCEVIVEHLSDSLNTSTITVGTGTTPLFVTLSLALYAGSDFRYRNYSATGLPVTTNINLKLTNNSGALASIYRVTIIGSQ